jgi:hypothetical protein
MQNQFFKKQVLIISVEIERRLRINAIELQKEIKELAFSIINEHYDDLMEKLRKSGYLSLFHGVTNINYTEISSLNLIML